NTQRRRACLVFFDETALSLTPNVRRSWAPVGHPAVLQHRFNWKRASMAAALCYGVRGGGAQLAFQVQAGNYDTDSLIGVLGQLRKFLGGEKATLLWAGLPPPRSRAMRAWLRTQRSWLVVERLPAYAPDLNPVEGLWSSLKAVELAHLTRPNLCEVHPPTPGLLVPAAHRPVGLLILANRCRRAARWRRNRRRPGATLGA